MNEFQKKVHMQLTLKSQLILAHLEQERGELNNHSDVSAQIGYNMRRKLDRITAALKRLDQGNFGKCISCKQEIGEERLECNPEAELCIHCQRKIELNQIRPLSYVYA